MYRQKEATINQHVRKPVTQILLKMKAVGQGPSLGTS